MALDRAAALDRAFNVIPHKRRFEFSLGIPCFQANKPPPAVPPSEHRSLVLSLVTRGADHQEAIEAFARGGHSSAAAETAFHEDGIQFPGK